MSEVVLNAIKREKTGKSYAKELRRMGKVPGIYYSHKEKNIPLIFDVKDILHLISTEAGLFDLKIDNKRAKKCIIKEIQFDPLTQKLVHLDVMGVKLKEKITVAVPIRIVGEAYGVKEEGGTLNQSLHEIEISCLPLDLPEHVSLDVSDLHVGDAIHVKDIKLDNIEILTDPEVVVVAVALTRAALKAEAKPVTPEEEAEKAEEQAEEKEEIASASE